MITRIMKYVSTAALVALVPMFWLLPVHSATLALAFVVWAGAVVVMVQAVKSGRYVWAAGFGLIALVFNPILPFVAPRAAFLAIDLCCLAGFLTSVYFMKEAPRLTIDSVTDTAPRSESL